MGFERLDKETAARAIRENQVPINALSTIANEYLESSQPKKATALLAPLFDGNIRKTNDDADGAWDAFQHAQRDDPKSPGLGLLEVQILNAQGRNEKAKQRADFRVRQMRRAGHALELLGKIPRYLRAKRIRKPKLRPDAIQFGGDDQAWYYREAMRDAWLQTPGALEWLKNAEKVFQ